MAEPMIVFHPCVHGRLVCGPTGQRQGWPRGEADRDRGRSHPIPPVIKILLCGRCLLLGVHVEHKRRHGFAHPERTIAFPFLKFLCHQFSNRISSNHPAEPSAAVMNRYRATHLAIFPSEESGQESAQPNVLPTLPSLGAFASPYLRDVPRRGCQGCPGAHLHLCRASCKPGLSLLFPCQPLVGNAHEATGVGGERKKCSKDGDRGRLGRFFV